MRGIPIRSIALVALLASGVACSQSNILPSWNNGATKSAIVDFVRAVTDNKSKDFVPQYERIAVFDNDGTLWSEQPMYFQALFMIDQVKAAAPKHPEWRSNPVFQALSKNDMKTLGALGENPLLELLLVANTGMTVSAYDKSIRDWLATARHPRFKQPYTSVVYKPMQELLAYLRENGFKTFIVSGGGIEFMRPWTEQTYGIPPEQVIGSIAEVKYDASGQLVREPKAAFVDDGPGKPVGIYRNIGRRPIAAFGNSDGDLQMLQYTAAGDGRRLMLLVHHDDATREYAYDRQASVGKLDKALDEAVTKKWVVVSMKSDWKTIFPFD